MYVIQFWKQSRGTCGDMSLCWLWDSWKAGLICMAGLRATAGVIPAWGHVLNNSIPRHASRLLKNVRCLAWCPWGLPAPISWVEYDAPEPAMDWFLQSVYKLETRPEPSLDFEVAGHLLCEGAVGDVCSLQPLAQLRHSEDALVGHPDAQSDSLLDGFENKEGQLIDS